MRPTGHRGSVREAAVAGRFYPADPERLAATVDGLLAAARVPAPDEAAPIGLIVPHAGFVYSGPVAASGYASLAPLRRRVRRVVVLGPAHFRSVTTAAVPTAAAFRTPLGLLPVAVDGCTHLVNQGLAVAADGPHAPEHSLEVQLPFLQRTLDPGWSLLPIVVGAAGDVAELLAAVTDETTLVVCRVDLTLGGRLMSLRHKKLRHRAAGLRPDLPPPLSDIRPQRRIRQTRGLMLLDQPVQHPHRGMPRFFGAVRSDRNIASIASTNGSILRDCHRRRAGSGGIAEANACRTVLRCTRWRFANARTDKPSTRESRRICSNSMILDLTSPPDSRRIRRPSGGATQTRQKLPGESQVGPLKPAIPASGGATQT